MPDCKHCMYFRDTPKKKDVPHTLHLQSRKLLRIRVFYAIHKFGCFPIMCFAQKYKTNFAKEV